MEITIALIILSTATAGIGYYSIYRLTKRTYVKVDRLPSWLDKMNKDLFRIFRRLDRIEKHLDLPKMMEHGETTETKSIKVKKDDFEN